MQRRIAAAAVVMMVVCGVALGAAAPDDKEKLIEAQYVAVATARTNAELAIRRARTAQDEADAAWRAAILATDQAYQKSNATLGRRIQEEQQRDESTRNPVRMEELAREREQLAADWRKFAEVERPALDGRYRSAMQSLAPIAQMLDQLVNLERSWKGLNLDMAAIEKAYTAVTQRAGELREQSQRALADLQADQKTWEERAEDISKGMLGGSL